jgi:hypothetical protein
MFEINVFIPFVFRLILTSTNLSILLRGTYLELLVFRRVLVRDAL